MTAQNKTALTVSAGAGTGIVANNLLHKKANTEIPPPIPLGFMGGAIVLIFGAAFRKPNLFLLGMGGGMIADEVAQMVKKQTRQP